MIEIVRMRGGAIDERSLDDGSDDRTDQETKCSPRSDPGTGTGTGSYWRRNG